jgi:hypothetical protein
MVDITNYRCADCRIFLVAFKEGVCYTCRVGSGRVKQFEMMVKDYLDAHPESVGLYSYEDVTLPCSPNRRRPDFVWILPDRMVVLEVDENAHRHYNRECEISRVTEVMEQSRGLPVFLIRFNPRKTLLQKMHEQLMKYFACNVSSYLMVSFIGYCEEYDVVAEIEALGKKRRRINDN